MNSVHDMGGMAGFLPVLSDPDEPVFHARWEARTLALTLAAGAWGKWNIDRSRHMREMIPGPVYLQMTYYERWLAGLAELLLESGLVTLDELISGQADPAAPIVSPRLTAERVEGALRRGGPSTRVAARAPRFQPGDRVRARNMNPPGHTRLPRYVRGRVGVIERLHGNHVFPDTNAHGRGENPHPLYGVTFTARELWGEAAPARNSVSLDLWEDYLEPL